MSDVHISLVTTVADKGSNTSDLIAFVSLVVAFVSLGFTFGLWAYERDQQRKAAIDARTAFASAFSSLANNIHAATEDYRDDQSASNRAIWMALARRVQRQAQTLMASAPPTPELLVGAADFIAALDNIPKGSPSADQAQEIFRRINREATEASAGINAIVGEWRPLKRPRTPVRHILGAAWKGLIQRKPSS